MPSLSGTFSPDQLLVLAALFTRFERHLRAASRNVQTDSTEKALLATADVFEDMALELTAVAAKEEEKP